MDIKLEGGLDGIDAAAEIGSSLSIPVIFLTAYADSKLLQRAKRAKPYGYLVKPTLERELRSSVEMALNRADAERARAQADGKWKQTFDAVPDLIMILDNEYRVVRANQATLDRLRITEDEIIGKKCFSMFHNTATPPARCPHRLLLVDGKEHSVEITEDGLGGTFDVSVSPLFDAQGRLTGSVHMARDINTTQKRRGTAGTTH